MKRVLKFVTGQDIPEGAIYLNTVAQTEEFNANGHPPAWNKCWLVWHYFLVEVDINGEPLLPEEITIPKPNDPAGNTRYGA